MAQTFIFKPAVLPLCIVNKMEVVLLIYWQLQPGTRRHYEVCEITLFYNVTPFQIFDYVRSQQVVLWTVERLVLGQPDFEAPWPD